MDDLAKCDTLSDSDRFKKLRENMAMANKRYRNTEKGKTKMIELRKAWIESKKNDDVYRLSVNTKQRERYHSRKLRKLDAVTI